MSFSNGAQPAADLPAIGRGDHRRAILRLLVAAVLLQDAVWVVSVRAIGVWPEWSAIVGMGLAFGQAGLAALLLLGTGPGRWLRGAVAVTFYFFAAYVAFRCTRGTFTMWLGIMLLDLAIVAAPVGAARLAGLRVIAQDDAAPLAASRQYSLLGLVLLTTLTAVLLGIARLMGSWGDVGQMALFALALGAIPWICGPLSLSGFHVAGAILAGAILCPLAGYFISTTGFPPNHPPQLIAMCYVQATLTIAACTLVRMAGYQLISPRRR